MNVWGVGIKLHEIIHCYLIFSGEDLPVSMDEGPRMTHTNNKKGLLMTYERGIYSFQCRSSNDCYWKKESYELETVRRYHVMIMVPSSLVENC